MEPTRTVLPDDTTLSATIAATVRQLMEVRDYLSFAEIVHELDRLGIPHTGDHCICLEKFSNLVMWADMSPEFCTAMHELRDEYVTVPTSSPLVYLADGIMLNMPIAKSARQYKQPHWCPVTLRTKARFDADGGLEGLLLRNHEVRRDAKP